MEPYEGLQENKSLIDLQNFNYKLVNWWNNAISSLKYFMWKGGSYVISLLRL